MSFESICSESCRSEIDNNRLLLIYSLELNGFNETKLFRCEKYNRIRFMVGSSLYGRQINLKTNYTDDYTKFNRLAFILILIKF